VVIGTGGLSHQLDGQRAGFINKEFDLMFMEKLITDPLWVTRYSIADLVELTGTQGVELINWLTTRGALLGEVAKVHSNYHVPISNTASGLLCMEAV
jgi:protocatechuate 4,5-dioxygenase beta chain